MKRIAFLTLFPCLFVMQGFAQADLQPVAVVNLTRSEPITVRQLRTEVERMEKAAGRALTSDQRREVLDVMINERLAIQAAGRDNVSISENEITQQINQLKAQMSQTIGRQPTDAEFAAAIQNQMGLEVPAFREQLRRQLLVQKYLMSQKQNMFEGIRVPADAEILNTYNSSRARFVRPETVRFSMIQVAYGDNAAAKTRARELADRLAREIGSSASKFDEVALRSQTPNSGYLAGDGGFLPRDLEARPAVGNEFFDIAFALKQGEISRVIEGARGYQIIKITETYTMKNLELDDIYRLGSRPTVREHITNVLLQERQMEVLKKATEELVTELRAGKTFQIFEQRLNW